ncbi:MAG: hypothetical protein L0Z68_00610 [Gammaproteobacteria bacterium]|nr:hypothetical protein [Gammaproteobacteria bacterium]
MKSLGEDPSATENEIGRAVQSVRSEVGATLQLHAVVKEFQGKIDASAANNMQQSVLDAHR